VKAMVDGYLAGAQCGHYTFEACVDEWQLHCLHGVHPHPVDPRLASSSTPRLDIAGSVSPTKVRGVAGSASLTKVRGLGRGRPVEPQLQKELQVFNFLLCGVIS
jgi:hypothetical protein